MAIETELVELLTGNAGIAALVSERVYPLVLPQNPALPAIVYQELRGSARAMADGDAGEGEERFLLSWWASSFAAIKVGKGLLVGLLSGYQGGSFDRIEVDVTRDDHETETGRWRQQVEILVHWKEE